MIRQFVLLVLIALYATQYNVVVLASSEATNLRQVVAPSSSAITTTTTTTTTTTKNNNNNIIINAKYISSHHRQLTSSSSSSSTQTWWTSLMNLLHLPCPPHGPSHDRGTCHHSGGGGGHHSSGSGGGGGGGSSGGSSNCDNDGGCDDDGNDDNNDASDDDDDTPTDCNDDGCNDDTTAVDDSTNDAKWFDDGWEANNLTGAASGYSIGSFGTRNASQTWGLGLFIAGVVGAAAFMVTKKRKRSSNNRDLSDIPQDVYIQQDEMDASTIASRGTKTDRHSAALVIDGDHHHHHNGGNDVECEEKDFEGTGNNINAMNVEMARSVKSNKSLAYSIKSALSKRSRSIKSAMSSSRRSLVSSRSRSGGLAVSGGTCDGNYRAPISPFADVVMEGPYEEGDGGADNEVPFCDDSISTRDLGNEQF